MYTLEKAQKDYNKAILLWSKKKFQKAIALFEEAAMRGIAEAGYFLGATYYIGDDVEQNLEKAEFWYRKSARLGYEDAIEALENWDEKVKNNPQTLDDYFELALKSLDSSTSENDLEDDTEDDSESTFVDRMNSQAECIRVVAPKGDNQ